MLTAGHPTPVRVRRRSLVGTVCGSGRSPRDEDLALGPRAESATLRAGMSRRATGMPFAHARRRGMRGPRVVTPAAITTPPSATRRVIPTTGVPQLPPLPAATTHPWRHRLLAKKAVASRSRI